MKPIAIFRHSPTEGPGYFATFLDEHRIPWQLVRIDAGDVIPADPSLFSGLGFMGGPMSVNDPLPWIPHVLDLMRSAISYDIPIIGHCLGGQLLSKALGGEVTANPIKEIGWHTIQIVDHPLAREWLGNRKELTVFQWHGDTFTIPEGATRLADSLYCENQAFNYGQHLGLQCHIEMTRALLESWCISDIKEIVENLGPSVQTVEEILTDLDAHVAELNHVARGIYLRWIQGLRK